MIHYYVLLDANDDGNLIVKPTGRTISLELSSKMEEHILRIAEPGSQKLSNRIKVDYY